MMTKQEVIDALHFTPEEREAKGLPKTFRDLEKEAGVDRVTIYRWKQELDNPFEDVIAKLEVKQEKKEKKGKGYDTKAFLKLMKEEADKALVQAALKGNVRANELINKITGDLVEKKEITIGLSAGEIARRNLEAARQLRETNYRVEEVKDG